MKTIVLGIGNTIRCDDGAGIEVVRMLAGRVQSEEIVIRETAEAGINLLDMIVGYEKLIIIDSIQTEGGKVGDIYRFTKDEVRPSPDLKFSHNSGIMIVLEWGRSIKLDLPGEIIFYAIEAQECDVFDENLTSEVKKAIPKVADMIEKELDIARLEA